MNFIDVLLLIPIIFALYRGFKNGFIIEICTLLALLVGIYAGIHLSDGTANFMRESWGFDSEYLPAIAFTITFLGVGAMIYFGGKMLEKFVNVAQLSMVNKFIGMFFGLVKVMYILSVVLVLVESYDEKGDIMTESAKEKSLLYHPVKMVSLTTIPYLEESLLFEGNDSDSTQVNMTVEDVLRAKEVADSLGIDANDAVELKKVYDEHVK